MMSVDDLLVGISANKAQKYIHPAEIEFDLIGMVTKTINILALSQF